MDLEKHGQMPHLPGTGKTSFSHRLVNYFLTGLVIAGPVGLTAYIAWWFIRTVDGFVNPLIPRYLDPDSYLGFHIPGYGVLVAVLAIMVFGFLTANLVGRSLVQFGERLVSGLPMISTLYRAIKQIFETVVTQSSSSFREVGLIQYPREGLWALVLISTPAKGEVMEKVAGETIMSVFLPTTPNPTSGFLLFVPRKDIIVLDMSTEDAAKMIISAGLVSPEYQAKTAELAAKAQAIDAETA